jgi:hypothetical protein
MFEFVGLNSEEFSGFTPKFNPLQYNTLFKNSFNKYVDATYSSEKINHNWLKYIIYYEIEDHLCIYFKKYFIMKIKKDANITCADIKDIIDKVVLTVKQLHIKLPVDYLFDILLELNLKQEFLILNHDQSERIHIQFKICNNIIQFFIKQNLFYECPIDKFNDLQQDIYNEYCSIEKSKQKIIYFNQERTLFDCEDTVYDLQKYMYINDYWLDMTFYFHKNSFQNNAKHENTYNYFIKYDIFLFSNVNILSDIILSIDDDYFEKYIKNKIFILVPYSYSFDGFRRIDKHKKKFKDRSIFDRIRKNNKLFFGCRKSDTAVGISSILNVTYNTEREVTAGVNELLSEKRLKYTNTFNRFDCDVLLPVCNINNDNLLDKKDFFKIHNLDINKPLITFFTLWPIIVDDQMPKFHDQMPRFHFDNELWAKDGYINELVTQLSKNYNVVFKPHPAHMKMDRKKIYFDATFFTDNVTRPLKPITDFYNKHKHLFKTNIIDYDYNHELLKYTDFGIVSYGSTVCNELYIHDIPLLLLKSKKNDWTKTYRDAHNNFINQLKKVDKTVFNDKIYNIIDIVYGTSEYIENLKETPTLLEKILNKNYKDTFPYFNNHPLYGNTYDAKQENIGKKIVDILKNNNNSIQY